MNTQNEPLEVRLQREARNKIWEKLTDSDSLWNTVDDVISHTIAETLKEAIELSDLIERQEPDGGTKQWMAFKRFRNTLRDRLAATTAVEGVGKK